MTIRELVAATIACPICQSIPIYSPTRAKCHGPLVGPVEDKDGQEVGYSVACVSCDFRGPYADSEIGAVMGWNDNCRMISDKDTLNKSICVKEKSESFKQITSLAD